MYLYYNIKTSGLKSITPSNIIKLDTKEFWMTSSALLLFISRYTRFAFPVFTPGLMTGIMLVNVMNSRYMYLTYNDYNHFCKLATYYLLGRLVQDVIVPMLPSNKLVSWVVNYTPVVAAGCLPFLHWGRDANILTALLPLTVSGNYYTMIYFAPGYIDKSDFASDISTFSPAKMRYLRHLARMQNYILPLKIALDIHAVVYTAFDILYDFLDDDRECAEVFLTLIALTFHFILCYFGYDVFRPFAFEKFNLGPLGFAGWKEAINTSAFLLFAYESHSGIKAGDNVAKFLKNGGFNLWPYVAILIAEQATSYYRYNSNLAYLASIPAFAICYYLRYQETEENQETKEKVIKPNGEKDDMYQLFIGNAFAIACKFTMQCLGYETMVGVELVCGMLAMEGYRAQYLSEYCLNQLSI